ncbi:transposase zinc-binding domain-containing protein [Rhizobium sp. BK226]|uniref:transposase zinc-binding domain-containing protein n=1 Tax=Rhizobium sp. BK226 TaxID=2587075 RepID=UPI00161A36B3|nr:transposase zinc-binding domain-containing protein [Rhizobium sp. BK226]
MRPVFKVADIFRRHGRDDRRDHVGHLGRNERRGMGAIEACRTPRLGGHVDACDNCGMTRISYNFCLMGRFSDGELACRQRHFSVNCCAFCLHNSAVLRLHQLGHQWPVTNGDEHVGDLLFGIEAAEAFTERAKLAAALERQGYSAGTAT